VARSMLWPPYTDERHSVAHWTGGWQCPRAKMNVVMMRKFSVLARNQNAGCSDYSPVTMYSEKF